MSKIFDNLLSTKSLHSKDPIDRYIFDHSLRYTPEQLELLEDIKNLPEKIQPWLGSTDEAQFFQLLIRLMNGKRAIEIGTFTGYTSLAIALALPSDGELITCDITDEYVRQDIWIKAGIRNKINLQIRPALETLKDLLKNYGSNSFDFIFIDGDKENYLQYYELSLELIRTNGLIAIDNTLWNGRVLNENDISIETITIRQMNELVKNDNRIDISFLRLGDGTTLYFTFVFLRIIIQKCFSSVHISPNRNQLQYSFIRTNSDRIVERFKRRTTSDIFQIHIHYDTSVKKLLKDEQRLIKEAVEAATKFWSKAIRPKYKLNNRIRLARQCPSRKMFIVENDYSVHYCSEKCLDETHCGDIIVPYEHLQQCHVCNKDRKCERIGTNGSGVNAEFILYVSALDTNRCEPIDTLATASFCQLEPEQDRPIAGNINVCPWRLRGDRIWRDFDRLVSTIKHEILHTLVFSSGLFAFFRDSNGEPFTERDPATRWPKAYDEKLQVYTPSDKVLKQIVRKNWKIRGGLMNKIILMLVTPKVQAIVREHFSCSTLEGAELENQGSIGTALTHWEKRLFEHEIMTGTYTQESVISNLTLALLEDSGWYDVSYEYGKPLLWGRNLGCDFVKTSCKQWIDSKLEKKQSPYPFCISSSKPNLSKRICDYTYDKVVMCNLIEYPTAVPLEYQIFDSLPNITDKNELAHFGGHVMLADYCPYNQELTYKNSNRDSRCYRSENQPPNKENYALEKYSSESKCFDHGSIWEQYIEQCRKKRRVIPQAAGCYQFECISSKGIYVHIGKEKYLCEYQGQNLTIITIEYGSIYVGTIICPDCQIICGSLKNFQCPSEININNVQTKQQLNIRSSVENLCTKLYEYNQSSMSDKTNQLYIKLQTIFLFFICLYIRKEF
ncbi:unnamed protein product [Rotaria sordida]|uniref:Leishmanolysin-like peptidase n=1 Tax=Rotaria sordida TaxID=392033 RepID=A0A815DNQ2_9BILA|nr:unnamed protein product [Rotaria sordida]